MLRVLLVDDEVFVRRGLRELIDWESCGFEVVDEADNGEDALELIRLHKPELVVTDIRMPVMDGLELIRKAIQEEQLGVAFIIISGFDEFKYAQQAVKYGVHDFILKPVDEQLMADTLNGLRDKLEHELAVSRQSERLRGSDILSTLIRGDYNEEQLAEWRDWLGIPQQSPIFYLFVEWNDTLPWNAGQPEQTVWQQIMAIRAAASAIDPALGKLHVHEHRGRLGLAVPVGCLPAGWEAKAFMAAISKRLGEASAKPVYLYAGNTVTSLGLLREAYQSAKETLQYKFTSDAQTCFIHAELKELPLRYMVIDSSFVARLTAQMEEREDERLLQAIADIFGEFRSHSYSPEAVKASIHRCVSGILEILERMEVDKLAIHSLEPIISWQDLNISLHDLKRLFTDFVLEAANKMHTQRKEALRGGIQRIKAYIDESYTGNISLKSIANQFYMNPVYLGQLFKKTYGVYFNEYVLQLRIEEAKQLLRQTDLRIYEISEKVGYNNTEYFVTQFEKLEQLTPTEYRNNWR
jgi:two-component system response regulator YesN